MGLAHIRRIGARAARREDGQALVEFALALPFLLLLLMAILQFGSIYNQYEALTDAARTGARALALAYQSTDPCDAGVDQTVSSAAGVVSLPYSDVTPTFHSPTGTATTKSYCGTSAGGSCTTTCYSGGAESTDDEATITVNYPAKISIFGWGIMTINLSTESSDAVE
jgi:Flp pilus assembly protein TadG